MRESFAMGLVKTEHFAGFDRDLAVNGVNGKFHGGFPVVGDWEFYFLVDVAF